ncbi:MAG TPA: hypothetical protein G4O08_02035 [Anaerolineae bacterium]|nr:hypothetical protein [Anaerolineae bacterium]
MSMKKNARKWAWILTATVSLVLLLALSIPLAVYAGEYIEGDPDATLGEDEVVEDDLFIAGDDILVAGTVEGDLFAAGENVVISGEVEGNVFAAGAAVTVSGNVEGSLILAGYNLTLEDNASIRRNVYFGGFSFQAMENSRVDRSIYGGGYQMILDGTVDRDITAGLVALEISGPVGGDVVVQVGETTGDFDTTFNVWAPGVPFVQMLDPGYVVDEDLVGGELSIRVTPMESIQEPTIEIDIDPAYFILRGILRRVGEFIALMLVGMLVLWLMRGTFLKAVEEVKSNAGMDTLWGILVYLLYIPVVSVIFFVLLGVSIFVGLITLGNLTGEMISISSLSFFGLLTLFGILTSLATKVVISYVAGRWILGQLSKLSFENYWHHVGALGIGLFLYEVLRAIPILGILFLILVVVIGTGAFFVLIKNALSKTASTAPAEVEAKSA